MLEMNGVGERTSVRRPYSIGIPVRGLARPLIRYYNVAQSPMIMELCINVYFIFYKV